MYNNGGRKTTKYGVYRLEDRLRDRSIDTEVVKSVQKNSKDVGDG